MADSEKEEILEREGTISKATETNPPETTTEKAEDDEKKGEEVESATLNIQEQGDKSVDGPKESESGLADQETKEEDNKDDNQNAEKEDVPIQDSSEVEKEPQETANPDEEKEKSDAQILSKEEGEAKKEEGEVLESKDDIPERPEPEGSKEEECETTKQDQEEEPKTEAKDDATRDEAQTEPTAKEATEESKAEETTEEVKAEEAIEESKPENVEEESKVEEAVEEPKATNAEEEPKAEEAVEEPKAENTEEEPKAEEAFEEPKAEEAVEEPKAENTEEEPKAEEAVEEPKAEEAVEEPKAENADEEPKAEEAVEEPKSENVEEESKAEEPTEKTKAEEATEEPKAEETTEEPKTEEAKAENDEVKPKAEETSEALKKDENTDNSDKPAEGNVTADSEKQGDISQPTEGDKEPMTDRAEEEEAEGKPEEPNNKENDGKISPRVDVVATVAPAAKKSNSVEDTTATVKFLLVPSGQVSTKRCRLAQTISNIKAEFAKELKIPSSVIMLLYNLDSLKDDITLGELVDPNGIIQIEMTSSDPLNAPLKDLKKQEEYQMPDILTVNVQKDSGAIEEIVVEIERNSRKKAYLGGFRHKKTGVEYYNAASQTIPKPRPPHPVERFCRDTQTNQYRHQVQQTNNTTSTQMTKVGCYSSTGEDKLVSPGKYTTADEFHEKRLNKVILIQKYYRRWLAKRYVERVKDDKEKRLEWERKEELKKKKEKEDRVKREYERRMNPKTKQDFDLLYHALEKWRQEEIEKINATLEGAERKAALCQLMEQQTELITSVGRHKLSSDVAKREEIIQNLLDKASSPKKWKGPDGQVTEMDTPYTLRAQELRDIYNSVTMRYLTQDERLDVLLTLKHTVKEHDCKLTREIVELIDREADLLMRGVKESNLEGLRKRISTLFLQYIKTPTFNPEIARHLKVPQDASTLRGNVFFCPSCKQYLPSTEFPLSSKASMGACRRCRATDNISRTRHDYSYYRSMLSSLRKAEEAFKDGSQIAFLLQDSDLRYLVENIWNGQSALSAWDDLYDLVLVRWIRDEHWSPWNCVLLTKEEAAAHEKLERLEEAYGKAMMHKVHQRHTIARNYFSRLPAMADSLKRLHPPKKYEEKKEKILQPRISSVKLEA